MSYGRQLSRGRGWPALVPVARALAAAVAALGLAGTPCAAQAPLGGQIPLGLNVGINEQAYVDLIQPTARFYALSGTLGGDDAGWPTGDFQYVLDNRYTFAWLPGAPNIDPLQATTDVSGVYALSFTGQAVLGGWGMTVDTPVYDPVTNTTTADVTIPNPPGGALLSLQFTHTRRLPTDPDGTGVTGVHLIRPGYAPGAGQIFTNLWLGVLTDYPWSALRFMDPLGTNSYGQDGTAEAYPYLLQWPADRAQPGGGPLSQAHPGVHGMPWEQVIAAANASGRDIWINIPVNASDGYVAGLAALLRDGLAPGIGVYVEYSNEMWHLGYPQGPWNLQAAEDEVAGGDSDLDDDGIGDSLVWRLRRIAERTVEIGDTFKAVFGDDGTRIRPVINNCFVGFDPDILDWVTRNYGPPSRSLYAIAQTAYYTSIDPSSVATVEAGEEAASDGEASLYVQSRTVATFYGLHSLVYEGGEGETGNGTPGPPYGGAVDPTLATLFAASRDPGMADVETHDLLGNWYPSGGDLYMQFGEVFRYSTYGFWGLSEDLTNQATGKWQGLQTALATPAPEVTAGVGLPGTRFGSVSTAESAPPDANFSVPADQPWLEELLRVPTGGGSAYTLTLRGRQTDSSGPLSVWVDNQPVGSVSLPASSDGAAPPVPLTLTPGLHALFVYGPPASGPGGVSADGDALTLSNTGGPYPTLWVPDPIPTPLGPPTSLGPPIWREPFFRRTSLR